MYTICTVRSSDDNSTVRVQDGEVRSHLAILMWQKILDFIQLLKESLKISWFVSQHTLKSAKKALNEHKSILSCLFFCPNIPTIFLLWFISCVLIHLPQCGQLKDKIYDKKIEDLYNYKKSPWKYRDLFHNILWNQQKGIEWTWKYFIMFIFLS